MSRRSLYYDMDGQPMSLEAWAAMLNDIDTRQLALDELPNGQRVSTVWLGLDHSFGNGPPLIFETMVFGGRYPRDLDGERYATRDEALSGHARIVARWYSLPRLDQVSCTRRRARRDRVLYNRERRQRRLRGHRYDTLPPASVIGSTRKRRRRRPHIPAALTELDRRLGLGTDLIIAQFMALMANRPVYLRKP